MQIMTQPLQIAYKPFNAPELLFLVATLLAQYLGGDPRCYRTRLHQLVATPFERPSPPSNDSRLFIVVCTSYARARSACERASALHGIVPE